MSTTSDLNADLGEIPGEAGRASDAAILKYVTSCAIACGGHAGDAAIMEATLREAARQGVDAGAHPSYPDRENFGRISMEISPEALAASLISQMQTLREIAGRVGTPLSHVKPHGALYNDGAKTLSIAEVIAASVKAVFGTEIALIGQPGSQTEASAKAHGLTFHCEGFIDRAYMPDGSLMPRALPGAVLRDTPARLAQARSIVLDGGVPDADGNWLALQVQTLCLHGDSPGVAETAKAVREALMAGNVSLRPAGHDACQ